MKKWLLLIPVLLAGCSSNVNKEVADVRRDISITRQQAGAAKTEYKELVAARPECFSASLSERLAVIEGRLELHDTQVSALGAVANNKIRAAEDEWPLSAKVLIGALLALLIVMGKFGFSGLLGWIRK